MKMSKIEILAPAGSMESVSPAVRLGADAVYFGMKSFSARASASNFDRESVREMIEYCHAKDVKAYAAINTLIKDNEMYDALELAKYLCSIPIDGVIVQDLGFAMFLRNFSKTLRIHGSTQMSVHTLEGAKTLRSFGFARVVLSRELSRDEILEIRQGTDIELEVFIHGALCMSVSGQCYYSALLGGRSGNRGRCAQPCRLPSYVKGSANTHVLSLKDMSHVQYIKDLESMGVQSVKIEGRMKRPEYVAAAVDVCRTIADGKKTTLEQQERLESVFSRSGFTDGYYTAKRGKNMFGFRTKDDVLASTNKKLAQIRELYAKETQTVPVSFQVEVLEGKNLLLSAKDDKGHTCTSVGPKVEHAVNVALSEERCRKQLCKTGGTIFKCVSVDLHMDENVSVPISALNDVRRDVLQKLEAMRKVRDKINFDEIKLPDKFKRKISHEPTLRARFCRTDISDVFKKCEIVYVPLSTTLEKLQELLDRGFELGVEIPRGMFSLEQKIISKLSEVRTLGVEHVLVGNIGAINLAKQFGFIVHGSFALNVMNSYTLEALHRFGVEDTELSIELSNTEIKNICGPIKQGIVAYGRLPFMLTRNCPGVNAKKYCGKLCGKCEMFDRRKNSFQMQCDGTCTEILNSIPLYLGDEHKKIKNVDFFTLRFTVENSVESEQNFLVFNNSERFQSNATHGLFYRSVD